jgi:hypothetical protein
MRLALVIPANLLLVGTVLLAGCGGGHDDNGSAFNPIPTPSTDDPFITIVRQQTDTPAATSEDTIAIDLTSIVETSPENTEPQSVTF